MITVGSEIANVKSIKQSGKIKRYDAMMQHGVHVRDAGEVQADFNFIAGNTVASTLLGIHGPDTHLIYSGKWSVDASGGYPMLALTDGGRLTITEDAHIDLVMAGSFYAANLGMGRWYWDD